MTNVFGTLAKTTDELARKSLECFGRWFARYLETRTGEQWDCPAEGKIGFAQPFLGHRVLEATEVWYGQETRKMTEHFIEPIIALPEARRSCKRRANRTPRRF